MILDGGSLAGRLNLILISEGYRASEIDQFRRHAEELATFITRERWYRRGLLNIHTHEVHSKEPSTWLVPGKGPIDTPFKAMLGGDGRVDRLITGNDRLVNQALSAWKNPPKTRIHVGVLVNSRRHGGRGQLSSGMFWTCTGAGWLQSALHEFGHSFADLRDEYSDDTGKKRTWTFPEPSQLNVTTDPTGQKWSHIASGVHEGAARYDYGIYRPFKDCRMRNSSAPFCAVCEDAILRKFEEHLEDPSEVENDPMPAPDEPVADEKMFSIHTIDGYREFKDNSAGAQEAVQWILKRQFGG